MKLSRYCLARLSVVCLLIGLSFQLDAKFGVKGKTKHKHIHKKAVHKPTHKINNAVIQLSNTRHSGAGVLPYCHHNGQLMFLIGKEGNNGQWADFGGGADQTDGNALVTAIREASEETRWIFGHNNKKQSMNYLRSHITHAFRHSNGGYTMACAKVNYIPAHVFKNGPRVPHWEKVDYEWVPANQLLSAIQHSDKFGNKTFRNFIASILRQNAHILRTL